MDLKIGDIVVLYSDGPEMTVEEIYDRTSPDYSGPYGLPSVSVRCVWMFNMNLCSGIFLPEQLTLLEKGRD